MKISINEKSEIPVPEQLREQIRSSFYWGPGSYPLVFGVDVRYISVQLLASSCGCHQDRIGP
jgi:hypothetical protein